MSSLEILIKEATSEEKGLLKRINLYFKAAFARLYYDGKRQEAEKTCLKALDFIEELKFIKDREEKS